MPGQEVVGGSTTAMLRRCHVPPTSFDTDAVCLRVVPGRLAVAPGAASTLGPVDLNRAGPPNKSRPGRCRRGAPSRGKAVARIRR